MWSELLTPPLRRASERDAPSPPGIAHRWRSTTVGTRPRSGADVTVSPIPWNVCVSCLFQVVVSEFRVEMCWLKVLCLVCVAFILEVRVSTESGILCGGAGTGVSLLTLPWFLLLCLFVPSLCLSRSLQLSSSLMILIYAPSFYVLLFLLVCCVCVPCSVLHKTKNFVMIECRRRQSDKKRQYETK